jgi:octaprenyl-diphosphate synthase
MARAYKPITRQLHGVSSMLRKELCADDASIASLTRHIAASRGAMIRPALLLLSGRCFGRVGAVHIRLATAAEIMHTATLLHDDVLDSADIRRRRASVNSLWGNDCAVLAGDFLLARMLGITADLPDARMRRAFSQTAETMCRGELRQDILRGRWDISEKLYKKIIEEKTAAFFGVCCKLGAMASGATNTDTARMTEFGIELGLAFQHTDDLLDIVGIRETIGKNGGSDLANGKLTLPFIRMMASLDRRSRSKMTRKLDAADSSNGLLVELRRSGALRYAYNVAQVHTATAMALLKPIPDCAARKGLLDIAGSVLSRIDASILD